MKINLEKLDTEQQNTDSLHIDEMDSYGVLKTINDADKTVAEAVEKQLGPISQVVDVVVEKLKKGGHLFYIGAGTSGRLAFIDSAECPPTYGVDYETVQSIMCGGFTALYKAKEGAEDDRQQAVIDVKEHNVTADDVLMGIAASGRTPYVLSALEYARSIGCTTVAFACCHDSEIGQIADYKIEVITGPEVIMGSTRMKAGTAQKLVLNMISTAAFVRMGKTYNNLMVDVRPTNQKLVERSYRILAKAIGCDRDTAVELYQKAEGNVKAAIVCYKTGCDMPTALEALNKAEGHLKTALRNLQNS